MGILDWFRKKTPQEKFLDELRKNRQLKKQVEGAISLLEGLKKRLRDFFEGLEQEAGLRTGVRLRRAIETHGFMIGWEERQLAIDPHETDAIIRARTAKWRQIKGSGDELLELFKTLDNLLDKGEGAVEQEKAISGILRQKFDRFCETTSVNLHQLWQDLKKYPELIDPPSLNRRFGEFKGELNREFYEINKIIEAIIVAERSVA